LYADFKHLGDQNHREKSCYVAIEFIALSLLVGICDTPWFDEPVIELIIFNTSQPSHPTIEGGLYSPWFDEPVIELIIFNTSQPPFNGRMARL
jgi:hypothetical protein